MRWSETTRLATRISASTHPRRPYPKISPNTPNPAPEVLVRLVTRMSARAWTNPGPDDQAYHTGACLKVGGGEVVGDDAAGHADVCQRVIPAATTLIQTLKPEALPQKRWCAWSRGCQPARDKPWT